MGATGKREFDTQDEVLEEAQKERIKYFNGYEPYHPARALKNLEP